MKSTFYKKGHITVFLSLILTLILSLVCTTIESARMQGVRMQLQNLTDMGIFSAFGEYNRKLLDIYDLFFIDTGYGTGNGSYERVNARVKDYIEDNTKPNRALSLLGVSDMWRVDVDAVNTYGYVMASDNKGDAYYSQAVAYMKDKLGISLAEQLLDQYDSDIVDKQNEFKESESTNISELPSIDSAKADYQERYDQALEEAEGDESQVEMEKPTEVENPVDTIKALQDLSILQLVMEDYSTLSQQKIEAFDHIPSKRALNAGDGTFEGQSSDALNKVLFNEYLFEKFPHILSEAEGETDENTDEGSDEGEDSDLLKYQTEYILCGKQSDKENLESVVTKLLLMREGINFAYLLSDNTKRTEAFDLATLLIGYLGMPPLVVILTAAILLVWAFAESVIEVRMLLKGEKVALIKNSRNWNLGISNLANLTNELDSGQEDEEGIDYEGYLKILMYFSNHDKKIMRSMDMIELTVQKESVNPDFKIDNCTQQFTTTTDYKVGSLFLRLPFKMINKGNSSYHYSITTDFSYY